MYTILDICMCKVCLKNKHTTLINNSAATHWKEGEGGVNAREMGLCKKNAMLDMCLKVCLIQMLKTSNMSSTAHYAVVLCFYIW